MKIVFRVGPRGDTAGFMKAAVTLVDSSNAGVGFEPGSDWQYSGGGYAILQLLIEDVSGESFEALTQRVVLRPLGMVYSTYTWAPNEGLTLATFYDRNSKPERLFSPRDWLASGCSGKPVTWIFSCSRWPFRVCFA